MTTLQMVKLALRITTDDFDAELADTVPLEQIEASVRFACGHLFGGEVDEDGARPGADDSLFGREG